MAMNRKSVSLDNSANVNQELPFKKSINRI